MFYVTLYMSVHRLGTVKVAKSLVNACQKLMTLIVCIIIDSRNVILVYSDYYFGFLFYQLIWCMWNLAVLLIRYYWHIEIQASNVSVSPFQKKNQHASNI